MLRSQGPSGGKSVRPGTCRLLILTPIHMWGTTDTVGTQIIRKGPGASLQILALGGSTAVSGSQGGRRVSRGRSRMTHANTSVPVVRTPSSCTTHTIPDIPVGVRVANAEYAGGFLYFCGGYNDDEGGDISGRKARDFHYGSHEPHYIKRWNQYFLAWMFFFTRSGLS